MPNLSNNRHTHTRKDAVLNRLQVTDHVVIGNVQVVGHQQPPISDATDEADAVVQLNALLAAMREHGLIAPEPVPED